MNVWSLSQTGPRPRAHVRLGLLITAAIMSVATWLVVETATQCK